MCLTPFKAKACTWNVWGLFAVGGRVADDAFCGWGRWVVVAWVPDRLPMGAGHQSYEAGATSRTQLAAGQNKGGGMAGDCGGGRGC